MQKETRLTISLQRIVLTSVALRFENGHVILSLNFRYSPRMAEKGTTANLHFAGDGLFTAITPSGHAQSIEIHSAPSRTAAPMRLLLIALQSCTSLVLMSIVKA